MVKGLLPGDYLRCASLWAQVHNWPKASRALERGLLAYPQKPELVRALDEVFQASGSPTEQTASFK